MLSCDLSNRVAFVYGGGRLPGLAVCRKLGMCGAKIAAADRDLNAAAKTAEYLTGLSADNPITAKPYRLDITDVHSIESAVASVIADFGRIDILVNDMLFFIPPEQRRPMHEMDEGIWQRIRSEGIDGLYYLCKAVSASMLKEKNGGSIVNITSIEGLVPTGGQSPRVAAAAACVGFSRIWGLEMAPDNIRVNAVAVGPIKTAESCEYYDDPEYTAKRLTHLGVKRLANEDDVAAAVLYLSSPDAGYVTGAVLPVDGGFNVGFMRSF